MAHVRFWQKPGCQTNARQRQLLEAAGHTIEPLDLLGTPWTVERLAGFYGDMPVSQWFNRASPRIKSGEIDPAALDADTAMALLLADPLLIRRPLMEAGDWRCAGFDAEMVDRAIGLALPDPDEETEGCAHGDSGLTCAN